MTNSEVLMEMTDYISEMVLTTELDIDEIWNEFNERYVDYPAVVVAFAWDEACKSIPELN
jgi:hypothetical protein